MFRFLHWYFLILIPIITYFFFKTRKSRGLKFSSINLIKDSGLKGTSKHKIGRYFIAVGIILLIIALARPQTGKELRSIKEEGIDIGIALDISGSMRSVDFEPSRLEVAKEVIDKFIKGRENDRISLVIFSGTAYTKIPLTLDYNILRESLQGITTKDVNQDGTAIGMGISVAINRLKKSKTESKVIILVTDGENNAGRINPKTATKIAKNMGIKIYTVGVGSDKTIIPVKVWGQTRYKKYKGGLDEALLQNIAKKTSGKYFRAKDSSALEKIFKRIDKLEKTEFNTNNYFEYKELAFNFIKVGILLIMIGLFLEKLLFMKIP